jgi:hypothetical protein
MSFGRHVVLWSAMRSGSTEFAKDLARACNWSYADEALNPKLSKFNPRVLRAASPTILKFFDGHYKAAGVRLQCALALERSPTERWCSLLHARRTARWSGRRQRGCGCTRPPPEFVQRHNAWIRQLPARALFLTFENVTKHRAAAIHAACMHCSG